VWLVAACTLIVVVFLALVLPSVFELKQSRRSYTFSGRVDRLVFDSQGTAYVHVLPSKDGRVHISRTSSISTDSRLIEGHRMSAGTLTFSARCTGSRLGVLRRCELHYKVLVPRKIALVLRLHFGRATATGIEGKLDFKSDAGDFEGSACSKDARFSLGFGKLTLRDRCVPKLVRARVRAGDVELTVPSGRYDVQASTHYGSGVDRPFANVIEDSSSPHKLDVSMSWGGSIHIRGARR
jgi:hypothetical protein